MLQPSDCLGHFARACAHGYHLRCCLSEEEWAQIRDRSSPSVFLDKPAKSLNKSRHRFATALALNLLPFGRHAFHRYFPHSRCPPDEQICKLCRKPEHTNAVTLFYECGCPSPVAWRSRVHPIISPKEGDVLSFRRHVFAIVPVPMHLVLSITQLFCVTSWLI